MKLNNRFIFGILSLLLAAVIAFVALPTFHVKITVYFDCTRNII